MNKIAMVIVGAMEEELRALNEEVIRSCSWNCNEVVVLRSGVGKVHAAIRITEYFLTRQYPTPAWRPFVLTVGTAGALDTSLHGGGVVIVTDAMQHDVDASAVGFPRGTIPFAETSTWYADPALIAAVERAVRDLELPYTVGRALSGDRFVADPKERQWLHEHLRGTCVDMETAAVAHACAALGVPWVGIRIVSDQADGNAGTDFPAALALAARRIAEIIPRISTSIR